MPSEELNKLIHPVILVQRLLWFIIAASIIFYIAFVYFYVGKISAQDSSIQNEYEIIIYILAAASTIGSVYYYRNARSVKNLKLFMTKEVDIESLAKNPRTKEIDEAKFSNLKSFSSRELKIYSLMFEYQKIIMITQILNEIIVILGSVLSFISGDVSKIFPFGVVSLVLCLWMFPRPHLLIKRVESL